MVAAAIVFTESTPIAQSGSLRFSVTLPTSAEATAGKPNAELVDGLLLVMTAKDPKAGEPRFQISDGTSGQLIFGMDLEGAKPGSTVTRDGSAVGFPLTASTTFPPARIPCRR